MIIPYYKQEIAKELTLRLKRPVDFSRIEFSWSGPRIAARIYNIDVGKSDNSDVYIKDIKQVELFIHPLKSLLKFKPDFDQINLIGGSVYLNHALLDEESNHKESLDLNQYIKNIIDNKYINWVYVNNISLKSTNVYLTELFDKKPSITKKYILSEIKLTQTYSKSYIQGVLYQEQNHERIELALKYYKNRIDDNLFYVATNSTTLFEIVNNIVKKKYGKVRNLVIHPKTEIKVWGAIANTDSKKSNDSLLKNNIQVSIDSPEIKVTLENNENIALTKISGLISYNLNTPKYKSTLKSDGQANAFNQYMVGFNNLKASMAGTEFTVNGNINKPDNNSPLFVNAYIDFGRCDLKTFFHKLPNKIIGSDTSKWLRQHIKTGRLGKAEIIWHGALDGSFPYDTKVDKPSGVFDLRANLLNATIDYSSQWPAIKNLDAILTIRGRDLNITTTRAKIGANAVQYLSANIKNLGRNEPNNLLLAGKINSTGSELAKNIVETPLKKNLGEVNKSLDIKGPISLLLKLDVPLSKDDPRDTTVSGNLLFNNNELIVNKTPLKFNSITGTVHFTDHSVYSNNLTGKFNERISNITIDHNSQNNNSKNTDVTINGWVTTDYLLDFYKMPNLKKYITGSTEFDLNLRIQKTNNNQHNLLMKLDSSLIGVDINLPKNYFNGELSKNKNDTLPLKLFIENDFNKYSKYSVKLSNKKSQDIILDYLEYDKNSTITINSKYVDGDLTFNRNSMALNLNRLYFYSNSNDSQSNNDINYFSWPDAIVKIKELYYNNKFIGAVSFNSTNRIINPKSNNKYENFKIEKFLVDNKWFYFNFNAESNRSNNNEITSNIKGNYKIRQLNKLVNLIDEGAIKDRIKLAGDFNLAWYDNLTNFTLNKVKGDLNISFGSGKIKSIEPGIGRLLGFFNLESLDKRLRLDFSDVFESGFKFNNVNGNLNIKNGIVSSDNLFIKANAADITVYGSTDVAKKTYQMKAEITPHITTGLPIAAAIVGTPVAGAAVYLLDKILESPVDQMYESAYSITGPWSKPVIKKLKKKRGKLIELSLFKNLDSIFD